MLSGCFFFSKVETLTNNAVIIMCSFTVGNQQFKVLFRKDGVD